VRGGRGDARGAIGPRNRAPRPPPPSRPRAFRSRARPPPLARPAPGPSGPGAPRVARPGSLQTGGRAQVLAPAATADRVVRACCRGA